MNQKAINALQTCVNTIRNCILENPTDADLRDVFEDLYDVTSDYMETEYPIVFEEIDAHACGCNDDIDVIIGAHNMLVIQMNSEFDEIDKSLGFAEEAIAKITDILDQVVQNQKTMYERIKKLEERKPVENHYHSHFNKTNDYKPPYTHWYVTCNTVNTSDPTAVWY